MRRLLISFGIVTMTSCTGTDGAGNTNVYDTDVATAADSGTTGETSTGDDTSTPDDTNTSDDTKEPGTEGAPNASEVFGYPYHQDGTPNPNFGTVCEAELPHGKPVPGVGAPANPTNCAGDPGNCGPNGCDAPTVSAEGLHRVTLDTEKWPKAVCNDGSPGIIEVRPGTGVGADRWLIWFKGGGGCDTQHTCGQRWCGKGKYNITIMSNDWNGDGIIDQGFCKKPDSGSVLDPNLAGNPFANANVVRIWYCGSDSYRGRGVVDLEDRDLDGDDHPGDFSLHFQGRHIVEAALATLDAGVASDNGVVTMPKLGDAKFLVISGSSAGALGAAHNMDSIAEHVAAQNPQVVVRGVLDANLPVSDTVNDTLGVYIDTAYDGMVTPGVPMAQSRQDSIIESASDGWIAQANAFHDQSCVDAVMADEGIAGLPSCVTVTSLLLRETDGLSTPTFVRFDIGDRVIGSMYKACTNPTTGEDCYDEPNHSFLALENETPSSWLTLQDAKDHFRATAIQVFEQSSAVTGIFSPNCNTHTGFTNVNFSAQIAADYADGTFGTPRTFMETLAAWLQSGGEPIRVIDASPSMPHEPSSKCNGGVDD